MRGAPPADIKPPELFRSLLRLPRPIAPIQFQFTGLEHPKLTVWALSAIEVAETLDAASGLTGEAHTDAVLCGLTARALRANGKQVFRSSDDVQQLPDTEMQSLVAEVANTLSRISPSYRVSHVGLWREALVEGARDTAHASLVRGLGGAYDIAGGIDKPRIIERPERYFGVPTRELLDGHWMAYHAARAVYEERTK